MVIDTNDKKLAVMQWNIPFAPAVVLSETSPFSQGDKQQLLWGYPGILWGELMQGFGVLVDSITLTPAVTAFVATDKAVQGRIETQEAVEGTVEIAL